MLGEFVLPHGGVVWTSTIIDGLALLGIGERNARQATARLGEDGVIVSERVGRSARWLLTPDGRRLLEDGAQRIYGLGDRAVEWDGTWLVILASVPEDERAKRHELRARLAFAGFGFLGPGVAVSPHADREAIAADILRGLGLEDTAILFRATTGSLVPDEAIIDRAWDLDALARRYERFAASFRVAEPTDPGEAFATIVELVHEWRRFPFEDPEIPQELLPSGWSGRTARQVFDDVRDRWLPVANQWYRDAARRSAPTASQSSTIT